MNKNPNLDAVPSELVKFLMSKIMFAIPPGSGMACADERTWNEMRTPLRHLVEAVLGAQKELFESEKEARRDALKKSSANVEN